MLQYCESVPDTPYKSTKYNRIVLEFYESGRPFAYIEYQSTTEARKATSGIVQAIKRNKLPIRRMLRGTNVYLIREER